MPARTPCPSVSDVALASVPLLISLIVTSTLVACYDLTMHAAPAERAKTAMHTPPGVFLPAISALGMQGTARRIYQGGFALAALLLLVVCHTFERLLSPHLLLAPGDDAEGGSRLTSQRLSSCVQAGYVCAAGIAMQGVFTLDFGVTPQSMVHWLGALLFVGGANTHCTAALELFQERRAIGERRRETCLLTGDALGASIRWKAGCLNLPMALPLGFGLCIALQMFAAQPAPDAPAKAAGAPALSPQGVLMLNGMGACQWLVIYSYILFFVSFSADAFFASRWALRQDAHES